MDFSTVASTTGLVNSAISVLKSARELAKDTSDTELKEKISEAYDVLLDLKERIFALDDENRKLKVQLAAEAAYIGPFPPHGYYYAASDAAKKHPLCPNCYQSTPQIIGFLDDPEPWNGGIRRLCKLNGHAIFEKPMDLSPRRMGLRVRRYSS